MSNLKNSTLNLRDNEQGLRMNNDNKVYAGVKTTVKIDDDCKSDEKRHSLITRTQSKIMGVKMGENRNGTNVDYLTLKQRQRIVKTWRAVQDRRQLGRQIYIQIFMHKPSLKVKRYMTYCTYVYSNCCILLLKYN